MTDHQSNLGVEKTPLWAVLIAIAIAATGFTIIGFAFYLDVPGYDPARAEAWAKVQPHLDRTREATRQGADESAAKLKEYFSDRKRNAQAFAAEVLSLGGQFAFAKGYLYEGSHEQYVEECFRRNIFGPDDLKSAVESAVTSYVSDIEGRENQMLVAIRADLDGSELAAAGYLKALESDAQFRHEYDAMMTAILPGVNQAIGRDITAQVGSEIAGNLIQSVATALAAEMGISGTVLAGSSLSAPLTFGASLVVGHYIGKAINMGLREAGHDPEGDIAKKVIEAIERVERTILEGDEKSKERHRNAWWRTWSFSASERESASAEVQQIEASGGVGIAQQLRLINEARANLREKALRNLILTGGAE